MGTHARRTLRRIEEGVPSPYGRTYALQVVECGFNILTWKGELTALGDVTAQDRNSLY